MSERITKRDWEIALNDYYNEPAFPLAHQQEEPKTLFYGITRLEYFTAKALQGVLADPHVVLMRDAGPMAFEAAGSLLKELFSLENGPCPE